MNKPDELDEIMRVIRKLNLSIERNDWINGNTSWSIEEQAIKDAHAAIQALVTKARIDERNRVTYELEQFTKEWFKDRVHDLNLKQWLKDTFIQSHNDRIAELKGETK